MWACPVCGRKFRNTSQAHSCFRSNPEDFFKGKPPQLLAAYRKLAAEVAKLGEVRVDGVKNGIMIKARTTFLAVKAKKDRIDLEFLLETAHGDPPVYKTVQAWKSRVAHFAAVESPEDITPVLIALLRRAYTLSAG
ncbi:MAG: hypothetical protein FJW39_12545 [Acidobacteria bacterium]|nr:hypothetical protein [Acidobacteriota bacterium]